MYTRILLVPLTAIFIFLLACQNKEKPPEQTTNRKPTPAAPVADTSASDTARARQYFARAGKFYNEDKFDGAIVHYEKTCEIYQA